MNNAVDTLTVPCEGNQRGHERCMPHERILVKIYLKSHVSPVLTRLTKDAYFVSGAIVLHQECIATTDVSIEIPMIGE